MTTETSADARPLTGRSGLYAWGVVLILMLAQTVSFIDRMIMGLLVGPIRESYNISDTQFSLLAGLAFAVFYSIMGIPLGIAADRVNRKKLIAVAITFWSIMTMLCGITKGFWSLFAARIGVGVGEAALSPAAYSIITDYFAKASLARALSVYTMGVTIGSGLAYIIGGWVVTIAINAGEIVLPLIGAREGWQMTFFIVGLPGLVVVLLVLMIREPERKDLLNADDGKSTVTFRQTLAFMSARKTAYATHTLGMALFIIVVFSVNIWGPEYLIRTFDYTRTQAGQTFGLVIMIAGMSGLITGGTLGDRIFANGTLDGYSRVIIFSMLATLPFVAMLAFASVAWVGIACIAGAVFFSAFQGGLGGGLIQVITPNQMRGQAVAIYFLMANLIGMGIGPTVTASLTDYVFKSDAALNKALALSGVLVIPIATLILLAGLPAVRRAVEEAKNWSK